MLKMIASNSKENILLAVGLNEEGETLCVEVIQGGKRSRWVRGAGEHFR